MAPNEVIDIPVAFNPSEMIKREATVYVNLVPLKPDARWNRYCRLKCMNVIKKRSQTLSNQKVTDNHPLDAFTRSTTDG